MKLWAGGRELFIHSSSRMEPKVHTFFTFWAEGKAILEVLDLSFLAGFMKKVPVKLPFPLPIKRANMKFSFPLPFPSLCPSLPAAPKYPQRRLFYIFSHLAPMCGGGSY